MDESVDVSDRHAPELHPKYWHDAAHGGSTGYGSRHMSPGRPGISRASDGKAVVRATAAVTSALSNVGPLKQEIEAVQLYINKFLKDPQQPAAARLPICQQAQGHPHQVPEHAKGAGHPPRADEGGAERAAAPIQDGHE